jgi:hypothetical protein
VDEKGQLQGIKIALLIDKVDQGEVGYILQSKLRSNITNQKEN